MRPGGNRDDDTARAGGGDAAVASAVVRAFPLTSRLAAQPPAGPSGARPAVRRWDAGDAQQPAARGADGADLSQLAGCVAHDVNNLLAVIRNYAALVTDAVDAAAASHGPAGLAVDPRAAVCWDTMRRDLAQIERAGERATRLTGELLVAARRPALDDVGATCVNTVVTETMAMLRRPLGERIRVRVELDDALWPVRVDPARLEQAITNLVTNARDAMPAGGTLTLMTGNVALGGPRDGAAGGPSEPAHLAVDEVSAGGPGATGPRRHYAGLWLSDTGTGMSRTTRARVFEPFFTTKTASAGTGLGMTVVRDVVAEAGGEVRISSTLGAGTTVSLLFPAEATPAAARS